MSEMKHVALLGAGAVGAYLILHLTGAKDVDFAVVAEGERAERLKKQGITINGTAYFPQIKAPSELEEVDLLVIALKYAGLKNSLEEIRACVHENTTVMSLMNGIDSEEIIAQQVGVDKVIRSVIRIASVRTADDILFDDEGTLGITFGEYRNAKDVAEYKPSERLLAIKTLFDNHKIASEIKAQEETDEWVKFQHNVTYNLPQAILGTGYGAYFDSEHVAFIRDALDAELRAIASANGIDLPVTKQDKYDFVQDKARYSTLQDIDNKRHTEVDMFAGALIKKGREAGIPTPNLELVLHMIHALEEKNDGKFEY